MSCAEKKQSPSSSPITSLPEDVVVDILARVPSCDYPRVSLVSKHFWLLVTSPEIYARRSSLGCTEHCLYVVLSNRNDGVARLYTLQRNSSRLVRIPGLPVMPRFGSFLTVGSRIYVFCGSTSTVFSIDCTSHTVQYLPRMPLHLSRTVSGVIGGRIYVIGYLGSPNQKSLAIMVFDTETQTWLTKPGMELVDDDGYAYESLVVMAGKMYTRGFEKSFVYDPKERKWETDEMMGSKYWGVDSCVVDDVLYFYSCDKELRAYDPENKCWRVVKGLDDLFVEMKRVGYCLARTHVSSYAGKLVFFFLKQAINREICCAEVSMERRKGGQIWGRVDQWCDRALIAGNFFVTKSLDVVL